MEKFKIELGKEGYYDPLKHDDATCLSVPPSPAFKSQKRILSKVGTNRRFLRARKYDLVKAKIMWIDTQNWRKAYKVDELYDTFEYAEKAEVMKLYPRLVLTSFSTSLLSF